MNEILNQETVQEEQPKIEYYWEQQGKEIKITFLDGKSLIGTLVIAHRYEIVLEIQKKEEKPVRVTVMKHAIKYITH